MSGLFLLVLTLAVSGIGWIDFVSVYLFSTRVAEIYRELSAFSDELFFLCGGSTAFSADDGIPGVCHFMSSVLADIEWYCFRCHRSFHPLIFEVGALRLGNGALLLFRFS